MRPHELPLPKIDLAALKLPRKPKVRRLIIEPYEDHMGEHELRVWIIFEDSTTDREFMSAAMRKVTRIITDAVYATGDRRFPYLRYVRNKELRGLRAG